MNPSLSMTWLRQAWLALIVSGLSAAGAETPGKSLDDAFARKLGQGSTTATPGHAGDPLDRSFQQRLERQAERSRPSADNSPPASVTTDNTCHRFASISGRRGVPPGSANNALVILDLIPVDRKISVNPELQVAVVEFVKARLATLGLQGIDVESVYVGGDCSKPAAFNQQARERYLNDMRGKLRPNLNWLDHVLVAHGNWHPKQKKRFPQGFPVINDLAWTPWVRQTSYWSSWPTDVCQQTRGPGWRMPTIDELRARQEHPFAALSSLEPYFTLQVFSSTKRSYRYATCSVKNDGSPLAGCGNHDYWDSDVEKQIFKIVYTCVHDGN